LIATDFRCFSPSFRHTLRHALRYFFLHDTDAFFAADSSFIAAAEMSFSDAAFSPYFFAIIAFAAVISFRRYAEMALSPPCCCHADYAILLILMPMLLSPIRRCAFSPAC